MNIINIFKNFFFKKNNFENILIYGMGMMGTSLALSLKKNYPQIKVTGVVRTKNSANQIKKIDPSINIFVHNKIEDIKNIDLNLYDLIIFALPIQTLISIIPFIPTTNTLITDMSSAQTEVQNNFRNQRGDLCFISSHPICGSENTGPNAAILNLFENKLCVISINEENKKLYKKEISRIKIFWESIGMKVLKINATIHDEAFSYLSHVPHIISACMCNYAYKNPKVRLIKKLSPVIPVGGGFKDMTRIAGSNPNMWLSIFLSNNENIKKAMLDFLEEGKNFIKLLDEVKNNASSQNNARLISWLTESKKIRDKLCSK